MLYEIIGNRFIEWELEGSFCFFIGEEFLLELCITCRYWIDGNMMLPTSEGDEMVSVEIKGWYLVADGLYRIRGCVMYCLPHFLENVLNISREGADVFVDCRQ